MAAAKAPDGFKVLTETISIHRPTTRSNISINEPAPPLFVICSWMAALPKHIQKYTDQYQKLYPLSTILLIQSTWKDVAGTDEFMKSRLELAISIIRDHLGQQAATTTTTDTFASEEEEQQQQQQNPSPTPKIFLHIFSNGGATIANSLSIQLNSSLSPSHPPIRPPFFTRLILECTPSRPNTTQAVRAMSAAALPANKFPLLIRLLGALLIRCYVSYGFWKCWILRKENMVERLRRRLNSPLPPPPPHPNKNNKALTRSKAQGRQKEQIWNLSTPRLYMYSRSDEVVSWKDVRDHAQEAREMAGFAVVREEVFENAPHVELPREDFGRYWGVVEGWWGAVEEEEWRVE
ncbi:hypothetical protein CERZMDRAFT_103328 [Cercospora zeae-maydis SCOH1-5]|uniref:Indole-diterpene biosynthesis protein PaxU n=1 Tax=Cercospora zeae-maydis SCOH1-5 TaxID=717836 RepID=A0A6A6EZD0_9PEZI|nr:hypothetical protein CERZMDRAFT_103328 [Cercospora zeae-maydis SCOH1-5]